MVAIYLEIGQPHKALELYKQALPIRREVGEWYGESVTRFNLALVYRDQGRL